MLLNRKQIEEAAPSATREVPVPEFGEGATMLIGTIGPRTYGRLMALFEKLPKAQVTSTVESGPDDEDEDGTIYTCDTPPDQRPGADREGPSKDDGAEQAKNTELIISIADDMKLIVEWAAAVILDPETLKPMFSTDEIDQLFRGPDGRKALTRIVQAAQELNLQTEGSREEFEKNSPTTVSDDSGGD